MVGAPLLNNRLGTISRSGEFGFNPLVIVTNSVVAEKNKQDEK